MYKVAIIGDEISVQGFKPLGVDTFIVRSKDEAERIFNELKEDYGILFITEHWYREILDLIQEVAGKTTPLVSAFPQATRKEKLGEERLKKIIERAVGADILERE